MNPTRSTLTLALLGALAYFVAPAAQAQVAIDVIGDSEITFEGLVQTDGYWYDMDFANLNADVFDGPDDFEMRRAELVLKGKGPGNYEWVMGYDAKADKWLDVNVRYKFGGNANNYFLIGQYKQLNSLEELSSTKNNDFVAKASITNTFGIARRLGAMYNYSSTNNWSIAASMFTRELTEHPAPTPHGIGWGTRGTWAPINETGSILHFGLSYNNYDTYQDSVQWRARPLADLANRIVDTGSLRNADRIATTGLESFWVHGPFKVQAEYMTSTTKRYDQLSGDFKGSGWYLSGVWNITGETWGYKGGTPTTPLPTEPATGMWQVGVRYDTIDLNDGNVIPPLTATGTPRVFGVLGGKQDAYTLGVNWYWRSNFKFMANYVIVNSQRYITRTSATYAADPANNNRTFNAFIDDNPNIFELRAQFYW